MLRDYQIRNADAVQQRWLECNSTFGVAATGTGKTVTFAELVRRMLPKRTMILAHREELIFQAKQKVEQWAGVECEIEMADLTAATSLFNRTPVVISTIQTQISGRNGYSRMQRFKPEDFECLIIDEAHHAAADSYRRVIDYYCQNPKLKVLGVTATPDRFDEQSLVQLFKGEPAFVYEMLDAIKDGWLVPIDQQFVFVKGLDFSHCRLTAGDLNGADLAKIMEDEEKLQGMVGSAIELIGDKKTLMFTSSVRHAEMAYNIFNRHRRQMAQWACGITPDEERRAIVEAFAKGKTQVLVNCALWGEGFDDPGVEVVVMGKPTLSRALYSQQCGRGTRPLSGIVDGLATAEERKAAISRSKKPSLLIIDYVGNSGRHKLMTSADILGGNMPDEVIERAIQNAKKSARPVRMTDTLEKSEEEIEYEKELREKNRLASEAKRHRLIAKVDFLTQYIDPFDVFGLHERRERGWDKGRELSEKQQLVLSKAGIDTGKINYTQGKQLLDEIFWRRSNNGATLAQCAKLKEMGHTTRMSVLEAAKLTGIPGCTAKQAKVLKRSGYDPAQFTTETASKKIDQLAANGWRRPADDNIPQTEAPKVSIENAPTEGQIKKLHGYHYPVDLITKDEATRLIVRLVRNGWRPLPISDPDYHRNWKAPMQQAKSEVKMEPVMEELPF